MILRLKKGQSYIVFYDELNGVLSGLTCNLSEFNMMKGQMQYISACKAWGNILQILIHFEMSL